MCPAPVSFGDSADLDADLDFRGENQSFEARDLMDAKAFQSFVVNNGIIGFFAEPITLKSGRKSNFYVNWRRATNDAFLLNILTDYIVEFLIKEELGQCSIYGVPEGATKTAVIAGLKIAQRSANFCSGSHTITMGRVKPKTHGSPEDSRYIGMPKGPTVVIEDTITTGGSLYQCLDQLRVDGVDVVAVLALTDRDEVDRDGKTFAENFSKSFGQRIRYLALSHAKELLSLAFELNPPSAAIKVAVTEEFKHFSR